MISGEEDGSFGSSASLQSKSTVLLMHEEDGQEVTIGSYTVGRIKG